MLVKGPFTIKWGENPILAVSELGFNYDVNTNDYETIQGDVTHIEGAIDCTIDLTLLESDVAALAVVLPQYHVEKGETLSTGETVTAEEGAIDIVAAQCDTTELREDLDITSCNRQVIRLKNARTRLSAINLDNNALRTVQVTFEGKAVPTENGTPTAILQAFAEGGIEES